MSPNVLADDFDPEVLLFFLNPLKTGISHTTSPHSQHHPADTLTRDITCFEEKKKVKRAKVNKKGKELEENGRV